MRRYRIKTLSLAGSVQSLVWIEFLAHLVRASIPVMCRTKRYWSKRRPTHKMFYVPCTVRTLSLILSILFYPHRSIFKIIRRRENVNEWWYNFYSYKYSNQNKMHHHCTLKSEYKGLVNKFLEFGWKSIEYYFFSSVWELRYALAQTYTLLLKTIIEKL